MSEANGLAPATEKAVATWCHGNLVLGSAPERLIWDGRLAVQRQMDPPGPPRGVLSFTAHPVIEVVDCFDGRRRAVQTFRVKWFDGSERFLCFCCVCGDLAFGDGDDLKGWGVTGCRKCGMPFNTVGDSGPCLHWHTFGSCLRCPDFAAGLPAWMPLGAAAGGGEAPPPAGPPATEQGPGSAVDVRA